MPFTPENAHVGARTQFRGARAAEAGRRSGAARRAKRRFLTPLTVWLDYWAIQQIDLTPQAFSAARAAWEAGWNAQNRPEMAELGRPRGI